MNSLTQSKPIESVTGVVLAGGRSVRMGTDKARLRFQEQTLMERSIAILSQCFSRTIVIANDPGVYPGAVPDDVPGKGPLGGMATALRRLSTDIFVVACDMPFLNPALIHEMAEALPGWEAVAVPHQHLHTAFSRAVLPAVDHQIAVGDLSVHGLLARLRVRHFSEAELSRYPDWQRSFFNVNTPADYDRARSLADPTIKE